MIVKVGTYRGIRYTVHHLPEGVGTRGVGPGVFRWVVSSSAGELAISGDDLGVAERAFFHNYIDDRADSGKRIS
jgi:hypothetical protein